MFDDRKGRSGAKIAETIHDACLTHTVLPENTHSHTPYTLFASYYEGTCRVYIYM
jgi:hypothetical protein